MLADDGVSPAFDRLMLEFDEPAIQGLLVELDEIGAAKRLDGANSCRRRDVDLGQIAADGRSDGRRQRPAQDAGYQADGGQAAGLAGINRPLRGGTRIFAHDSLLYRLIRQHVRQACSPRSSHGPIAQTDPQKAVKILATPLFHRNHN